MRTDHLLSAAHVPMFFFASRGGQGLRKEKVALGAEQTQYLLQKQFPKGGGPPCGDGFDWMQMIGHPLSVAICIGVNQ
jgi:hypothetical protein